MTNIFQKLGIVALLSMTPTVLAGSVVKPAAPPSQASQPVAPLEEGPLVKATLFVDHEAIEPGQVFWVAITLEIRQNWHIYWPGHNDTGMAPIFDWHLPDGWKIGEPRWPAPKTYESEGGLVDNVLDGNAFVLFPVKASDHLGTADRPTIACDIEWLVCQTMCIAERQSVQYTFEAVSLQDPAPRPRAKDAAVIKMIKRTLPQPIDQSGENNLIAELNEGILKIEALGIETMTFTPTEDSRTVAGPIISNTSKYSTQQIIPLRGEATMPVRGIIKITRQDQSTASFWLEIPKRTDQERDGFALTKASPKP